MNPRTWYKLALLLAGLALLAACGGGSGGGSGNGSGGGGQVLTITSGSILPGTLQGHAYSATLTATGGTGALHWSIAPISPTALFVNGLTIDPNTGQLSGTANWGGTAGFIATLTDSATTPHSASKSFTITAYSPLQPPPAQSTTVAEYRDVLGIIFLSVQGGVPPLSYTVTGGSLPPGLRLDAATGRISGSAFAIGTYPATVTIQDSFSPPELVTLQLTIKVIPPALSIAPSLPQKIAINEPFSGKVVAVGGVPPYKFALASGSLPTGLSPIDPSAGQITGTPTAAGVYGFTITASDSQTPPQSAGYSFYITVAPPIGRNDTPATATPIANGMINASISPYQDPPNAVPFAGDNDYYKLVSVGGATVHLATFAKQWNHSNPLDTVLEIVDANGVRLSSCRQPGDTSTTFASSCINDDMSASPHVQDSALDFLVPGAANVATTFYAHVLDWRGDARPDMNYALSVSGLVSPLVVQTTSLLPAARGLSYSQQLSSANGTGTVTWSISSGSLPPGLALSSAGAITGSATTDGNYSFTVQAVDSGTPPQTATAPETIQVVEPVKITSSATFPPACVNVPYSFAVQTSGGLPPLMWSFMSSNWVAISLNQSTGVFSGTAGVTGTFTGTLWVGDATTHYDSQQVSLTVNQCP